MMSSTQKIRHLHILDRGNPILVLPWLIVTFPVFVFVSYCTLKYSRFTYLAQLIFNIFFICLGWCLWLTVFQFLRHSRDVNRKPQKT
ncbi:hypothetical protein Zmor_000916 [Zophobas morio]|uniref:Uncharacterized protein n=1 Tax=Zophobas morio TaxID=2755281 RepID=A0AA38MNW0_9CUCU|nr:hypothetical protein Zmor_000916 [Zophobas morio]